jgi:hypothetical protein
MEIKHTEPQTEERLPWHKPEVQRLVVSLDTKAGPGGSGVDAAFSD